MNQRSHLGTTYLDTAKGAVETFMKLRARDPASRGDRYMLVTFEEPPYAIKAGWKENHATFMNELKNLQAEGLTTLGQSLRTAFDLLNLNRLVTGIDNYGQGRNPFFLEPAIIITITDGSKLTTTSGVQDEMMTLTNLISRVQSGPGGEGLQMRTGTVNLKMTYLEKICCLAKRISRICQMKS